MSKIFDYMALSKNKIKLIHSLDLKKNRIKENLFVCEGHKCVDELLKYFDCKYIVSTEDWAKLHQNIKCDEFDVVSHGDLAKASLLKTPQDVVALFSLPESKIDTSLPANSLCLALDDVQNPGNVGTIIRLADWFGIKTIYCSDGCADVYSPKTVQATMGALGRITVYYVDLVTLIKQMHNVPVYATLLDGQNIYDEELSDHGLIIMGNEGNGISTDVEKLVNHRLYIPNYPIGKETSESLNVAMATGIVCAEFRRRVRK